VLQPATPEDKLIRGIMNDSVIEKDNIRADLYTDWIKQGEEAFSKIFTANHFTDFDKAIFRDQYDNVVIGCSVAFDDTDDLDFKRIRSNRLKMFGYSWHSDIKTWIK